MNCETSPSFHGISPLLTVKNQDPTISAPLPEVVQAPQKPHRQYGTRDLITAQPQTADWLKPWTPKSWRFGSNDIFLESIGWIFRFQSIRVSLATGHVPRGFSAHRRKCIDSWCFFQPPNSIQKNMLNHSKDPREWYIYLHLVDSCGKWR